MLLLSLEVDNEVDVGEAHWWQWYDSAEAGHKSLSINLAAELTKRTNKMEANNSMA